MPTAPAAVWQNVRQAVTLDSVNIANAFASRITAGASRRYMEATVYCMGDPYGIDMDGALNRDVEIACGATFQNYRVRFRGQYVQPQRSLWPGVTQLICKGRLFRASRTRPPGMLSLDPITHRPGIFGVDLSMIDPSQTVPAGSPPGTRPSAPPGQTDEAMVSYLLAASGLTDLSNIGGTGRLFGVQAGGLVDANGIPSGPFVWVGRTNALAMIESIDEVSIEASGTMAYRTLESLGGVIYRVPLGGRPRGVFDVPEFTQGVDIFRADAIEGGTLELGNFAIVTGWDDGAGLGSMITIAQSENGYQPADVPMGDGELNSPMIEYQTETGAATDTLAANGRGMSTELASAYVLAQVNRLTKRLSMVTPRDDYCGPGQTHGVLAPAIALTEPLWLQDVTIETNVQAGSFLQTFDYLGGGTESGVLPPQ